ncbi:MAG: DNA-processing protein DprA, partial [Planctomycetota bacterium]|nr:DNA-processing protein DprA [Planctomycetota bacterium]
MNDSEIEQTDRSADPSDLNAALTLCLTSGVGPRTRQLLLGRFGSAAAVLNAAPSDLRDVPGVDPKIARAIQAARLEIDTTALLEYCHENDVHILHEQLEHYPRLLRELPDPPGILFVQGSLLPRDAVSIAVVGSRHASHYGLVQAERLAGALARAGVTIVSGLARGIDAAAHR